MNPHLTHHHDHASVLLDGDLDWPRVHDLIHALEDAIEYYQYGVVEIRVRSLGGSDDALRHLLDRLRVWRERGVRIRTRAVGRTSSAAALLVALGDERVAEPGARLRFHGSSMYRRGDLSAAECGALHARLARTDERIVGWLAERALVGSHLPGQHGAEESDWNVLEPLCLGAAPDPGGTAPARMQTLATALGQTVDDALHEGDRETLARLYGRLIELDRPISGKLARTLRLVDRVAHSNTGSVVGPDSSSFDVPEGIPFASPAGDVAPETLLRHVLVLGDDVHAATSLCLAPLVTALAKAPPGQVGPVLVLNPDPELRAVLHAVADERLQVVDPDRTVLDLMAGKRSIAPALEAGRWMTAATSILRRTLDLVAGSPSRCLQDVSGRVVDPVLREGTHLAVSVVGFILMMMSTRSRCPEGWVPDESRDRGLCADLLERAQGAEGERGPNLLALASWLLGVVPGLLPACTAKEAILALGSEGEARDVHRGLSAGGEALSFPSGRAWDVLSVAQAIVAPFALPAARTSIYFGCEPGLNHGDDLDFGALVSGARDARFVVIDPQDDGSDGLLAAGVKQLFLEAVVSRSGSGVTPRDAPLCGYIARGFERFVTPVDLAFLDGARTGGGFAILESKSVSAIEHALRDVPRGEATFGALRCAAGAKLFLRSSDPRTQELARGLAPRRPGLVDVLDVRPLSGLALDECYVSGVDGRFERRRLVSWAATALGDDPPGGLSRVDEFLPSATKMRPGEPS